MPTDPLLKHPRPIIFSHNAIFAVVLVYAVFAALWILLSDKLIQMILNDPEQIILVSILKGWVFVGVTSMLLYGLMHRWVGDVETSKVTPDTSYWLSVPFLSLVVIILVFTSASMIHVFANQKAIEMAQLRAIADFKTKQIADWLKERQGDAEFVQSSDFFAEKYRRWQASGDLQSGERLQVRLEQFRNNKGLAAVTLLDPQKNRLWGAENEPLTLSPNLLAAADKAKAERKTKRLDPYRDTDGNMHLDFIAPLTSISGPTPLVILHANLADWLFPTLQTWPVPSASGETLIFRRDGDQVVYLNDLRRLKMLQGSLKLPVSTENLLAAKMLRGEVAPDGSVEGEDYRGISAIGVVRAISGTDWFLIAKLDKSELYDEVASDFAWIGFAGLVTLCMAAAGFYLLRQGQQLAVAHAVQQSQSERLDALQMLGAIADSSDDAIFAKDLKGDYVLFNRAACQFVGKTAEEVLGHDDKAIFPAGQAEMLMALGKAVIAENRIMTQAEVLNTPEGQRVFLATKGPLRDVEGNVIGIFGISRDITEMKRVEQSLYESEERLRLAQSSAQVGIWDWQFHSGKVSFTAEMEEILGYSKGSFPETYAAFSERVHPDDLVEVECQRDAAVKAHKSFDIDFRVQLPSGTIRWVNCKGAAIYDEAGTPVRVFGVNNDITERKITEEALQRQAEELAQHNDELARFNRATVGRELEMIALKQQINELSSQLGCILPYQLAFLNDQGG